MHLTLAAKGKAEAPTCFSLTKVLSASSFEMVLVSNWTFCSMSELATSLSDCPTWIRTGSSRKSLASCRTCHQAASTPQT